MTRILFVTGSSSKLREAAAFLEPYGIELVQHDLAWREPKLDDPRAVARWKARTAHRRLGQPVLVDDVALTLEGYPCFPGAYTAAMARVLGPEGLCRLLQPDQRATFTAYVCYHDGRPHLFVGRWHGRMQPSAAFDHREGAYNSFFVPNGFDRPLAQLPWEVRLQHSHRRRALDRLARFLARDNPSGASS
jgi:non-canonical purine NTP pyrophosphatase (RdgB/HAM1 family)